MAPARTSSYQKRAQAPPTPARGRANIPLDGKQPPQPSPPRPEPGEARDPRGPPGEPPTTPTEPPTLPQAPRRRLEGLPHSPERRGAGPKASHTPGPGRAHTAAGPAASPNTNHSWPGAGHDCAERPARKRPASPPRKADCAPRKLHATSQPNPDRSAGPPGWRGLLAAAPAREQGARAPVARPAPRRCMGPAAWSRTFGGSCALHGAKRASGPR
jgi:hypothetical protein